MTIMESEWLPVLQTRKLEFGRDKMIEVKNKIPKNGNVEMNLVGVKVMREQFSSVNGPILNMDKLLLLVAMINKSLFGKKLKIKIVAKNLGAESL